jgi:hypothetical protein
VAAGGGEEDRRVIGERPHEDSRGEGDELASDAGSEEERRWRRRRRSSGGRGGG